MDKIRVYELAKELNTTSKRLMEKLAEINIIVKNHMSLLEDSEIEALYKHIGIISHGGSKKADTDEEKKTTVVQPRAEVKKVEKKSIKSTPRIIRVTEINLDSKDGIAESGYIPGKDSEKAGKKERGYKHETIKVANASSGLRAGFVRDTRPDFMKDIKSYIKPTEIRPPEAKEAKEAKEPKESVKDPEKKQEMPQVEDKSKVKPEDKKHGVEETVKTAVGDISSIETIDKTAKEEAAREPRKKDKQVHVQQTQPVKQAKEALEPPKQAPWKETKEQKGGEGKEYHHDYKGKKGADEHFKDKGAVKQAAKSVDSRQKHQKTAPKPIEIPKVELTARQKEELISQRGDLRREFQGKNSEKEFKREQRKEASKAPLPEKMRKFKPQSIVLSQKKGISEVLSEDFILDEFYSDKEVMKTKKLSPKSKKDANAGQASKEPPAKAVLISVKLPESMSVKEFAEALKKPAAEVIKKLMGFGLMLNLNEEIDFETAAIIADEFGVKAEKEKVVSEEELLFDESEEEDESQLVPRPPIVVVMGHVDHGKTSLLDAIRKTNVIESEAGGITQHIGAYTVTVNDRNITFLDTPGHEAFTAMRARGAKVTDIAILVVAADDGVMPQTIEAINHAKAANVAIIVAINKIDKPDANPDRVKQQLTEHGLVPEEWGGDVICVPISAKNGENIDQLLEMVLLTADILDLKGNPHKQAKGVVIEAKLDKNRGPIATLIIQRGTLKVGDSIITGTTIGRIRAMINDKGQNIKEAGQSTPVEVLGLPEVPEAGETFYAITDEKIAKHLIEKRKQKQKEQQLKSSTKVSLDDLFKKIQEGQVKELNIIIKADVQGSVEALKQSLEKLSNDEVRIRIIHDAVGAITESDVTLADVSNAIIIGFNVRPGTNVMEMAQNANVDIRLYRVIYDATNDIQAAMKGMLKPKYREVILGYAEVRQLFKVSGVGTVGGCYVTDGKIVRNSDIRVVRNGIVVHEGKLASLKRFKDDAREVPEGFECGLSIEKFNDIKEADIIESYVLEEITR